MNFCYYLQNGIYERCCTFILSFLIFLLYYWYIMLTFARLWLGSLVNRASDSGYEGRGFDSHPGHILKKPEYQFIKLYSGFWFV